MHSSILYDANTFRGKKKGKSELSCSCPEKLCEEVKIELVMSLVELKAEKSVPRDCESERMAEINVADVILVRKHSYLIRKNDVC